MKIEDLQLHIKQLQTSLMQLSDAAEAKCPVDEWNYTSEQLQELREMYDFRKLQVKSRTQMLIGLLGEELCTL